MLTYDQALRDLADYSRTIERQGAEIAKLRAALEAIVNEYGRDPEIVNIPLHLISAAEDALEQKVAGE